MVPICMSTYTKEKSQQRGSPRHVLQWFLGFGVAVLVAMGTSNAVGATVRAWDVSDVGDQVTSMGGKWMSVDSKEDASG